MVSFQPTFKLMLVSLNLVLLLCLLPSSALANGLHTNHDGAPHTDNVIRRHAARAGRLSKRFPPILNSNADAQELDRREPHHRTHGSHGLTQAEISQLLVDEEIADSSIYIPPSNATNSTTTRTHTRHRTRTGTHLHQPSGASTHRFSASASNETAASNTTSSALPTSTSTTSLHSYIPVHNSTSSSNSSEVIGSSSNNHTSANRTTSSTSASEDGSTSDSSFSSSVSNGTGNSTHTSSDNNDNNVLGGILDPLLGSSTTSSTPAAQKTPNSQTQQSASGASSFPPFSANSLPLTDEGNGNRNASSSSSQQSKTSQPDFFSFTPQATRSSTQFAPSSTASGLVQGLLPLLGSSSSFSDAPASSPSPTPSPNSSSGSSDGSIFGPNSQQDPLNGSDSTDAPVDQGSATTGDSASATSSGHGAAFPSNSSSSGSSDIATSTGNTTAGSTTSTGTSDTVTTGPTSTSLTYGPTPTGNVTDGGSGSGSSVGQHSSSVSSSAVTSQPTWSSSAGSGSSYSSSSSSSPSSSSSTATTNPYWYANTKSLNLAPSSSSSAAHPAETGSHSSTSNSNTDSDSSTTSTSATGSDAGSSPAPQDLPTTIVPSADSYNQPPNTTSIALLFKQDMQWSWVISQADLTAQIFAFMPDLVSQAVSLESSKVSTVKLASYTPETPDTVNAVVRAVASDSLATARTLYMAYVPTSSVEKIQAMISNTSSPFYTSAAPGAPQQLASQVDPTFDILSVAGQVAAGAKQNATSGSGSAKDDSTLRNSLIGVGCGLAGIFAVVAGGLMWRKQRKDKDESAGGNAGGVSRAHTIRSFSGGLRETWAPDALDQHRALNSGGEMQQVWSPNEVGVAIGHPTAVMQSHGDGFGGYVASDPFQDGATGGAGAGGYVNMNRSSRMTERSNYSDLSQMTEAQRIQYDYESSRRSFHSTSDHSGSHGSHSAHSAHSNESAEMVSTYQDDYRVPRQHTSNHAFGARSNSITRSRRRGSVASSTIGRPEMMSNSVLL